RPDRPEFYPVCKDLPTGPFRPASPPPLPLSKKVVECCYCVMKRKKLIPYLLPLVLALFFLSVAVRPAGAHASLVQSIPEANARLDRAPVLIELFFSEPVEDGFSSIEVLDTSGERVDNNDAGVDPADPTRMSVTVRSLPDGIYTVSWRTLSS